MISLRHYPVDNTAIHTFKVKTILVSKWLLLASVKKNVSARRKMADTSDGMCLWFVGSILGKWIFARTVMSTVQLLICLSWKRGIDPTLTTVPAVELK